MSCVSRRATSSLPVPFSPDMRTRPLVGPALAISSLSERISADSPIISYLPSTFARRSVFSASSLFFSSAFFTVSESFSSDSGFSIKSYAPWRTAFTAVSMLPCPDITMTSVAGCEPFILVKASMPSMPGIQTSRSTTSGWASFMAFSASVPVSAVVTS